MIIRSGYSFRYAYGHLHDIATRLKEIGWDHAPLSDRESTFGLIKWTGIAKELGLQPIYGIEIPVVAEKGLPPRSRPLDYWTFFAINSLVPLHNLIAQATTDTNLMELSYEDAQAAKGLVKITGNRPLLDRIKKRNDVYVQLSPATPIGVYRESKERKFTFIATSDNTYPRREDRETYRIALGPKRANSASYPQHILSDTEWRNATRHFDKVDQARALLKRDELFKCCYVELEKSEIFPVEKKLTLRQICERNAKGKGVDLRDKTYRDRLDKELKLIAEKNFEDYFYIITDLIAEAKKTMIVGPARGSSCGSLVCYLLDITTVDPLKFGLIFERFIDITRADLPDIDIDFSDVQRDNIFRYVERKYGADHVARLSTVITFQPKSILNAAGIALKIPSSRIEQVANTMIERSSGDSRAGQQFEDTLKEIEEGKAIARDFPNITEAAVLENHPNNAGLHSAGICITKEPINRYVAIDKRNNATMCDKYDAEKLNFLKIDMLGLTQLSVFERTLKLVGKPPLTSTLNCIPLDDKGAFDVLNQGKYYGIFQFNGTAVQSLAKQIKIERLDDIVALTALARPGPLANGGANDWVSRRMGRQRVVYPHPAFEPYLRDTFGVVVYQETVMQIGRELGDLSWEDVTALRKAMSKSLGAEYFNRWGDKWKEGACKKGIPNDILDKAWDDLCQFGSWGFNKSHAVAYGLVSYYCAYFKAHFPLEFAAAALNFAELPLKQLGILRELDEEGIKYKAVDKKYSTDKWQIFEEGGKKLLLGPLTNIKGIGIKTADLIIQARENGNCLSPGIEKKLDNPKTSIDCLYPIANMIERSGDWRFSMEPIIIKEAQCGYRNPANGDKVILIGLIQTINPRDENDPAKVAKRGREIEPFAGNTMALNIFICDDTDRIFCKVSYKKYRELAPYIINKAKKGRSVIAFKGTIPSSFRMLSVENFKILGEMESGDYGKNIANPRNALKNRGPIDGTKDAK